MSWVRLDDSFPTHPKVLSLSDRGFRLHITALCWSAMHLTDGQIPREYPAWPKVAEELVEAGLWDRTPGGYAIHDYLDYNRSRADVMAERQAAKDRRSGSRRANVGRTSGDVQPHARRGVPTRPDPTHPDPTPTSEPLARGKPERPALNPLGFDDFWANYPRKVGKPKAKAEYVRALRRAGGNPDVLILGASRYRDDPNRDEEYTAHPTTWLNRDGWEDAPLPERNGQSQHPLDRTYAHLRDLADGR